MSIFSSIKYKMDFKKAVSGDSNAQYQVGAAYGSGKGIELDYCKAIEWYQKAMLNGNAAAAYILGIYNDVGKGTPINKAKADELYRLSSSLGHAPAAQILSNSKLRNVIIDIHQRDLLKNNGENESATAIHNESVRVDESTVKNIGEAKLREDGQTQLRKDDILDKSSFISSFFKITKGKFTKIELEQAYDRLYLFRSTSNVSPLEVRNYVVELVENRLTPIELGGFICAIFGMEKLIKDDINGFFIANKENSGTSKENPVIITAGSSRRGVELEYEYLSEKYGKKDQNWFPGSQMCININNRKIDILHIKKLNNVEISTFFDITSFYGRLI